MHTCPDPVALSHCDVCSYGYDPLGLGSNPEALDKYRVNEVIHARWAMLAAAGIMIPEGLQANGADIVGGTWFETGSKMLNGGTLKWFVVPWGIIDNPLPLFAVVAINAGLIGAAELYRGRGTGPAGFAPGACLQLVPLNTSACLIAAASTCSATVGMLCGLMSC